jgi:hypothetical protein
MLEMLSFVLGFVVADAVEASDEPHDRGDAERGDFGVSVGGRPETKEKNLAAGSAPLGR